MNAKGPGCPSASDWRPLNRGALKGTFSLTLPSGMILRECAVFERDGRRWVVPPQKMFKVGEMTKYATLVEFVDRATRDRFSETALSALDQRLDREAR